MNTTYASLFESFTFSKKFQVKNRLVMAPMTNFSSNLDGTVTDREVEYYARRSSGVGMVITGEVLKNALPFHWQLLMK